ncbi:MAG: 16S rRNA processing protein RimM, partial [Chloroflexota bacterium]|nr:16S rRNA processing protein RimM [Chloroflexota bacterium]
DFLGELIEVVVLESNDVYVVRGERGEVLVPATSDVVREIDLPQQRMIVEPVPGLLPWEEGSE